jgi:MFS family permease
MTPPVSTVDPNELLAESREELARADGKASMLLSALGVAIGVIAAALLAGDWSPDRLDRPYRVVWWVGLAFAGAGSLALCLAVWPRIRHHLPGPSATYFDEIALLGSVERVKTALARTDATDRTLTQLVAISRIARRKYKLIRWAMLLLGVAIVLVLIAMIAG